MITFLAAAAGAVYAVGFLVMCFLTLMTMGFPSGPGLGETVWFTVFWPISLPVAVLRDWWWRRGQR